MYLYMYSVSWIQELLALAAVAKAGLAVLQFSSESLGKPTFKAPIKAYRRLI